MEVCAANFLETNRLEALMSPSDKSDISASSSLRSSPDGVEEESSSRSNSESMEEVWSDDVETAFYEALEVFPGNNNKKRIRMADGKVYGRNYLIACYIKQKCGKVRNVKQISSHLQVITRRQKLRQASPPLQKTITPSPELSLPTLPPSSQNIFNAINIHPYGQIKMVPTVSPQSFNLFQENPIKMVVSEKLTLPMDSCYIYDFISRQMLLQNGGIYATLPLVKLSSIQHRFDQTLPILFQCLPPNAFYIVKCWVNMEENFTESTKFFDSKVFSSPYKMDFETMGIACSYGNRINCINEKNSPIEEIQANNQISYMYRQNILWTDYGIPVIKELSKLHKEGGIEAVKIVLNNFSWLTILTDKNTSEILLVMAYIFEHTQHVPGYRMFKLVN